MAKHSKHEQPDKKALKRRKERLARQSSTRTQGLSTLVEKIRESSGGDPQRFELLSFKISREPTGPYHCDQVDDWAYEAMMALRRGDGKTAEKLLKQCLEVEPDMPDLLNNLAAAYEMQKRHTEAEQLIHEISRRWPDYFFGQIGLAGLAIGKGDYDRAESLLTPLRRKHELHVTEFVGLCNAYINLLLVQSKIDGAKSWIKMLKEIDPDHPSIESHIRRIKAAALVDRVAGLFRRGK